MTWHWATCTICGANFSTRNPSNRICSDTNAHFNIQQKQMRDDPRHQGRASAYGDSGYKGPGKRPYGKKDQAKVGGPNRSHPDAGNGCFDKAAAILLAALAAGGTVAWGIVEAVKYAA